MLMARNESIVDIATPANPPTISISYEGPSIRKKHRKLFGGVADGLSAGLDDFLDLAKAPRHADRVKPCPEGRSHIGVGVANIGDPLGMLRDLGSDP
jgi:hypothetical protein